MRNSKVYSLALAIAASVGPALAGVTDWYPETIENRPFVRWWWHGSAVDSTGLTYNLEEFARKGLGGVEITPIYGVKGNERNDIQYLSSRWMDMLGHVTDEARRLGLQVDMNNGTGWPFGGPEVTVDDSAPKLIVESWNLEGGKKLEEPLKVRDARQAPVAVLQRVMAVSGNRREDITRYFDSKKGILKWRAPKGRDWKIYAIFMGRTFQQVKRAAPGGEGLVVNHYDSLAIKNYLSRFDRAFAGRDGIIPNTFFNDSFEVYGSDWSGNLLDEFHKDNGYKLEEYIPELIGDTTITKDKDLRGRVLADYRRTLGRILYENFTRVWNDWAHSHGARIRNQSHGSPANILDLYAAVDIPEIESFGMSDFDIPGLADPGPSRPSDADPAVLKFASSAAHIAGKPLTSAESLTWLTEHFRTSLSRAKPELDQMLTSGVNHIYFHGAPYSPKDVEFPGWLFYASINMSPTNALWEDTPGLMKYLTRNQAFLSAGHPDTDFLLYFPIEDLWNNVQNKPYLMFAIHSMYKTMPGVKKAVNDIIAEGYDLDYLSDALIDSLSVQSDGRILSRGGNNYRAVIVPPTRLMQPETLRKLLDMASGGASLIFVGNLPQDVPGLGKIESRRKEFSDIISKIPVSASKTIDSVEVVDFGKGRIVLAPDFAGALAFSGVMAEPLRKSGVSMLRRRNEAGGYNYFLSLLCNRPFDGWAELATPAESAVIFDPLTGKSGMADLRQNVSGKAEVRLKLEPGETLLLKTYPELESGTPWIYQEVAGEPVALDHGWRISFTRSNPHVAGVFNTDTLTAWTSLPDSVMKVNSGTGRYSNTFEMPSGVVADDWVIDLGDVRETARVYVNGQYAGTAWCVPFRLSIGSFLRPGKNTIDIDVTNLDANRIADYERRGVEWRIFKNANIASVTNAREFSFGDWDVVPSGLNSTVRLIPMRNL